MCPTTYKQIKYKLTLAKPYFWHTTQQQEINSAEEKNGRVAAFEFTRSGKKKHAFSKTFFEKYQAEDRLVSKDKFRDL